MGKIGIKNFLKEIKKRWNVIKTQADADIDYVNPLKLCLEINQHIEDGDIIVADGGDFCRHGIIYPSATIALRLAGSRCVWNPRSWCGVSIRGKNLLILNL